MLAVLLPAVAGVCFAHASGLDHEVGRRALPWLPPDLARQIVHHQREFTEGVDAARRWPRSFHQLGGARGLEGGIATQCERIRTALRQHVPFGDIVAALGALAHLVADLNAPFPAGATAGDAAAFAAYVPSATPRIPLVFYGQDLTMIKGPASGLARALLVRRQQQAWIAEVVHEDLFRVGGPDAWQKLDDRSSSFGAASVVTNHAATDFANLAAWIWQHAGGLVPEIPAFDDTILVWKGEPQPREAPRTAVRVR